MLHKLHTVNRLGLGKTLEGKLQNRQQTTLPKISIKCSISTKIKINTIVNLNFTVEGKSNWSFGFDYDIKVSSKDSLLKIYDDKFNLDDGWSFITQISRSKIGKSTLNFYSNKSPVNNFVYEFIDEKSTFNLNDKDILIKENLNLIQNDHVCFRVADKELAKLLHDESLVLNSYNELSGFDRIEDYQKKGIVYKNKIFEQSIIWKRKKIDDYELVPYDFRFGQEKCFSNFINETISCMGIHVYHFILLNGYHVLLLLIDNTDNCKIRFKIIDQLKNREWELIENLDNTLLDITKVNYPYACDNINRKDINSSLNLCKIKSK